MSEPSAWFRLRTEASGKRGMRMEFRVELYFLLGLFFDTVKRAPRAGHLQAGSGRGLAHSPSPRSRTRSLDEGPQDWSRRGSRGRASAPPERAEEVRWQPGSLSHQGCCLLWALAPGEVALAGQFAAESRGVSRSLSGALCPGRLPSCCPAPAADLWPDSILPWGAAPHFPCPCAWGAASPSSNSRVCGTHRPAAGDRIPHKPVPGLLQKSLVSACSLRGTGARGCQAGATHKDTAEGGVTSEPEHLCNPQCLSLATLPRVHSCGRRPAGVSDHRACRASRQTSDHQGRRTPGPCTSPATSEPRPRGTFPGDSVSRLGRWGREIYGLALFSRELSFELSCN
nr:uncharacterized protein LOC105862807 [Microcebus murinus]